MLALLLLVGVAMLCGARSQSAIADWGRCHGQPWLRRRGFTHRRGPRQATLSRLFRAVPRTTVEAVRGRWAAPVLRLCPPTSPQDLEGIAVDGQRLRGSVQQGAADAPLLSAFSQRLSVVVGQVGVPDKTHEIGAVDDLLCNLVLEGRVVTADALLTQQEIARTILASRGEYLLMVKANQGQLHADIVAAFAVAADFVGRISTAYMVDVQGGRIEQRQLTATTALVGYSDWPGLQQALKLERRVSQKTTGQVLRQETAYAITSCSPRQATPALRLRLWRGHWHIENRRQYIRDVPCDEDRATVRAEHAPQVRAAFRNRRSVCCAAWARPTLRQAAVTVPPGPVSPSLPWASPTLHRPWPSPSFPCCCFLKNTLMFPPSH